MTIHSKILEAISIAKTKKNLVMPYIFYYTMKIIDGIRKHLIHIFNLTALKISNVDCGHNLYTHGRLIFSGPQNDKNVIIGKNCWIGLNSIILKGVSIGDNSVIGAGSVVVKDIPSNCLAVGSPAKVIKCYKEK